MTTGGRISTFPSVLETYKTDDITAFGDSNDTPEEDPEFDQSSEEEELTPMTPHKRSRRHMRPSATSRSSRVLSAGERRRQLEVRRVEDKRLEGVADRWDHVVHEARQDRAALLTRKIDLQLQLIQAQDRRAVQQREEEEQHRREKRDDEKKAKEAKIAGLQATCKESLANDRQQQVKDVPKPPAEGVHDDGGSTSSGGSAPRTPSTDSSGRTRSRERKHRGYLPSDSYAPATSPMRELEEEDERKPRGGEQGVVTPADLGALPWHHAQLYKLYGRQAESYINPKMQPEKKKVVNPTLKAQKGHMGASHIWTTLRGDSMAKLYRTDRRFPQELKEAFSSHVREGINKQQRPVYRNFTEKDDVPDLPRLMDQSLLRRVRVLRHKTELMYRSSQTNNDRTKVLLFNSPLPDVCGSEEGIQKYLPSWEDAESEVTEAEYKRWLQPQAPHSDADHSRKLSDPSPRPKMHHPSSVLSPLGSTYSDSLHNIWHDVMARQRPRPEQRLHFLTEDEARTQGMFLEKLGLDKEKQDMGRVDLLPRASLPIKAMSARDSHATRLSVDGRLDTAPASTHSRYQTSWQPLSMHALMEYKEHVATDGGGDFHQGRPRMWKTEGQEALEA